MALTQPDKTLADYVAIALSPALIMVLVGSWVFFLLEIGYGGEHLGRLRWTLFWFVLAAVLISRISIEQGSGYAGVYGIGLAAATALLLDQMIGFLPGVWLMLGLIWWCASKLTWDCTLIDEDADASGEGLLQVAGIEKRAAGGDPARQVAAAVAPSPALAAKGIPGRPANKRRARPVRRWERLFLNRTHAEDQPHAPGLWVVYISLAALPIFGIGQLMIPRSDRAGREFAFVLLGSYVAAALGLLLGSSFLGLRRYLRQRYLQMPASMAGTWLTLGAILGAAVLLGSVLLPRPDADYSLTALVGKIGSKPQTAAEAAVAVGPGAAGPGRPAEPGGTSRGRTTDGPEREADDAAGDGSAGPKPSSGQGKGMDRSPGSMPPPNLDRPDGGLGVLLKWILYGVFVLWALRFLARNGRALFEALRAIWRDGMNFLSALFGGGKEKKARGPGRVDSKFGSDSATVPFAAFKNPFAAGAFSRRTPAELVCYSFEALQAWAEERRLVRPPQQTPIAFSRALSETFPELSAEAGEVSLLYSRWAYDEQSPAPECVPILERLWRKMSGPAENFPKDVRALRP